MVGSDHDQDHDHDADHVNVHDHVNVDVVVHAGAPEVHCPRA
jgi:hypothetical protein